MRNISPSERISVMLFMAGLVLLLCPLSNAQQEPTKKARPNSLQKGAWSLQFELDENFQPQTFRGTLINIKRHYSEKTAVRLGVSITANFSDEEADRCYTYIDPPDVVRNIESDINHSSCDLLLDYLFYPLPKSDMNLFLGVGPHMGFAYIHDDYIDDEVNNGITNITLTHSKITSWIFGASGVLGVEWFLRHNISFLAEYGVILDYHWESRENDRSRYPAGRIETMKSKIHGFNLLGTPVKFGMSVYF